MRTLYVRANSIDIAQVRVGCTVDEWKTCKFKQTNKHEIRTLPDISRFIYVFFFFVANFVTTLLSYTQDRLCITLYSKWEDRDYRETALKIDTFSALLKLSYIDIQRLSLPEGYAKKIQPSRQKEEKMHRLK